MKRLIYALAAFLMLASVCVVSSSTVLAATNVNNFEITDFQIDYYLGKDNEGRSTLKTIESISAVFPDFDQNHGIERAIPSTYDNHSTGLRVLSVTDAFGKPLDFTSRTENRNEVLRIGDADTYVHGLQTYKITYTQRDVTKYFSNTNDDEFYWDTNGTEWAVPVQSLTVRLHIDEDLQNTTTDNKQCYVGRAGSRDTCNITATAGGFAAKAESLSQNENLTLAIGFQPHTFAPYQMTWFEKLFNVWIALLVVTTVAAVGLTIWFLVRFSRRSNRSAELGTIVPEYLPPPDTSVSTSGSIVNKSTSALSAQLIDFAVRHYLKIYQTREKSLFKSANYEPEIIKDTSDLKDEEQEVLRDLFGEPKVGDRLDMESLKKSTTLSLKLSDNQKKLNDSIKGKYKLRARDEVQSAWFKRAAIVTLVAAIVTLSPPLLVAAIAAFICAWVLKPLTDKGLELFRYLKGLEMYIKVAEAERLKMLQSPQGAAKVEAAVDTNDKRQLITLYERVLPYAILFGQEKDWNKQLGQYYQSLNESPSWYSGNNGVFNAAVFASAMSSFNSAVSYSDPSNSSSGGSGGGGSSGGGGGGGGGGGW